MRTGLIFIVVGILAFQATRNQFVWGFFGHRLINRLAVFTLPEAMIEFYKSHLDYITDHSVDPDKRRYAVKTEAICHFIDLDKWIYENHGIPDKDYLKAILKNSAIYLISKDSRTLLFDTIYSKFKGADSLFYCKYWMDSGLITNGGIELQAISKAIKLHNFNFFDGKDWIFPANYFETIVPFIQVDDMIEIVDRFSNHGILPYNLERCYNKLVKAFETENVNAIVRCSAEIGHYIGDAHVPLHTSMNYNGQLTKQHGIHAFWESRIPELFAIESFDFVVGKAKYIGDVRERIWEVILESHQGVSMALEMERKLSVSTPDDEKYCYDTRLNVVVKTQCKAYAKSYMELLDHQVEDRMRESILTLGSIWMTAWYEAGQPDLNALLNKPLNTSEEEQDSFMLSKSGILDREHE